ncbi:MAG: hypothetical protein KKE17_04475 [Proteobacteria bacterium]|nr:hypothetical protein [Pseudomonadota bacterium]MBU1709242.1 hypothetical protein [Pseudomonadota bacterium]
MYPEDINEMKLTKSDIIQKAVETFKDPSFKIENFDRIKVMVSEKAVIVFFNMSVRYVPFNGDFFYGVAVDLTRRTRSLGRLSNPRDTPKGERPIFYAPSKEFEQAISFVTKLVGKPADNATMDILDNSRYYDILVISEFQESSYKIDKATGQIFDERHNHLVPAKDIEEELFREIK